MSDKKQKTKATNIYFLFGEDHFRLNLALKALLQKFSHLPLKKMGENDDFQSTIWEISFWQCSFWQFSIWQFLLGII